MVCLHVWDTWDGATIGLMSVKSFPTAVRGMEHGISARFGKIRATIGTQAFTPLQEVAGEAATFYLASGVGVLGTPVYYILRDGKGVGLKTMDEGFERYIFGECYVDKMGDNVM